MVLVLTIALGIIAYFFSNEIRKYDRVITLLSMVIASSVFLFDYDLLESVTIGYLGLSFYILVMFAGALKKSSTLSKRLRSVRKEFSIYGFILLLPHAIVYGLEFYNGTMETEIFGLAAYIIMAPLFLISFKFIKRKMSMSTWKDIQSIAYIVYLLIFAHLIMVSEVEHSLIYLSIFTLYSILKVKNHLFQKSSGLRTVFIFLILFGSFIYTVKAVEGNELVLSSSTSSTVDVSSTDLSDGTYYGTGSGYKNLTVSVEVVVEDGEIAEINVLNCGCTSSAHGTNFSSAVDYIASLIVSKQTTDVDTYSGATYSTRGLIEAVEDALSSAQ